MTSRAINLINQYVSQKTFQLPSYQTTAGHQIKDYLIGCQITNPVKFRHILLTNLDLAAINSFDDIDGQIMIHLDQGTFNLNVSNGVKLYPALNQVGDQTC